MHFENESTILTIRLANQKMQFSIKSFSECERFLEAIACYVLLSNNDDDNIIISYLFYNQTDKNGAYKKESVRL